MKIKELTKGIFESIRYGAREASMVEQLDARIGLEFEFHVNLDHLDLDPEEQVERLEKEYRNNLSTISTNIVDGVKRFIDYTEYERSYIYDNYTELKQLADRNEIDKSSEKLNIITNFLYKADRWYEVYDFNSFIENLVNLIRHVKDMFITNHIEFIEENLPGLILIYNSFKLTRFSFVENETEIEESFKILPYHYKAITDIIDDPTSNNSDISNAVNDFLDEFAKYREDYDIVFNLINLKTDANQYQGFDHDIQEIEELFINKEEQAVKFVKSKISEYVDKNSIQNIMQDSSVKMGAEVITEPLEYSEAMQIIDDMVEFISDYGYTSDSTGLHMNVSLPSGMTLNDIDPLVFLLLLDSKFIDDNFAPRNHVESMINSFIGEGYGSSYEEWAAYDYLYNGVDAFIDYTRSLISQHEKSQQINFKHLGFEAKSDSRIEYRAPGGAYVKDVDLIKSELTRLLYMLNATINYESVYPKNKMLKDLIRLWDRVSMKSSNRTFDEVIEHVRKS